MAGRYATALFELALEERAIDKVKADLDRFDALIGDSADLRRLVRSPAFTAEAQSRALAAVLEKAGIGGGAGRGFPGGVSEKRGVARPGTVKGVRQTAAPPPGGGGARGPP